MAVNTSVRLRFVLHGSRGGGDLTYGPGPWQASSCPPPPHDPAELLFGLPPVNLKLEYVDVTSLHDNTRGSPCRRHCCAMCDVRTLPAALPELSGDAQRGGIATRPAGVDGPHRDRTGHWRFTTLAGQLSRLRSMRARVPTQGAIHRSTHPDSLRSCANARTLGRPTRTETGTAACVAADASARRRGRARVLAKRIPAPDEPRWPRIDDLGARRAAHSGERYQGTHRLDPGGLRRTHPGTQLSRGNFIRRRHRRRQTRNRRCAMLRRT